MSEETKIKIAIGVILFLLAFFAWYSLSTLPHSQKTTPASLSPSQTDTPVEPAMTGSRPLPENSRPVDYIPTNEEIQLSIEDQNQKRIARDKLRAARDRKAEVVISEAKAASEIPVSQDTVSEDAPPKLSPEERAARNDELRDGIKAHRYFPR